MWLHTESGIITISARQRRIIMPTCRQSQCKPRVVVAMPPSIDSWGTHGNDIVHIYAESWDCPSCEYGPKVNISGNDTSRRIATSFTAYGVKKTWITSVSGRNFFYIYPLHCQIGEKQIQDLRMASLIDPVFTIGCIIVSIGWLKVALN